MSGDYHQGIFSFTNGFETSVVTHQESNQIRREKLRFQGFDPPPPLEVEPGEIPVYETAGMLSEMFNYAPAGGQTTTELFQPPQRPSQTVTGNMWYGNRQGMVGNLGPLDQSKNQHHHHDNHHHMSGINADSAAAMQLFLMNPQPRSPSQSPHQNPSNFNLSGTGGGFGTSVISPPAQFTWVPDSAAAAATAATGVENQGLSLSLSSSLQHLDGTKVEELRMGDGGLLYYNQGVGSSSSSSSQYPFKNPGQTQNQTHQIVSGFGSSIGMVNVLRNTKYVKAAQELLEEFCSVGRGQFKKNKFNTNTNPSGGSSGGGGGGSSSSKDVGPLSAGDRIEHQRRKVKLLSMLDEVDRRYTHYCEQMQMVVNSFDLVLGFGAAIPYTALAQKAMSRHFRCLKDAISAELKHSCELLGEKDGAGTSGITKGETPRLKLLEQSLRQQRAFHQMGMMDQEAWRPQRGLPERSVNILRAWLFEHFLHPYPSDADKHLLARQTGLSRNQVSNWFINARVRLWKPMVEEMYQQESKDDDNEENQEEENGPKDNTCFAQTPTHKTTTAAATSSSPTTIPSPTTTKRSEINASDNDPSLPIINTQSFSQNQPKPPFSGSGTGDIPPHHFPTTHDSNSVDDDIGSSILRFGTTSGEVSLTLGLRHAGNQPEKSAFSLRDFGGC